jgi:hypothetical protein
VGDFVRQESEAVVAEAQWLARDLPYRSSSSE